MRERLLDVEDAEVDVRSKLVVRSRCLYVLAGVTAGTCMIAARSHSTPKTLTANLVSQDDGWGSSSCYKYTGESCYVGRCLPERNATCTSGRCWCKKGCVGSDGLCRTDMTEYKLIAKNIKFRNLYFTDQYLYAPRTKWMEQLRTAAKDIYKDYDYHWNLYELPGKMWIPKSLYAANYSVGYYLSPSEFPEFAAGIASNKLSLHVPFSGGSLDPLEHNPTKGLVFSTGSKYVVDLYHLSKRYFFADLAPFNPELNLNYLCRPVGHPHAIQLLGGFAQVSWYTHFSSWEVFGWVWGDPGHGGYWVPEPQLNLSLPQCPHED